MALTRYTLTGTFGDLTGDTPPDPSRLGVFVRSNVSPSEAIVDEDGNRVHLGALAVDLNETTADFSIDLVGSLAPLADLQYEVVVEYPDDTTRSRRTWRSGWFSLNGDVDLADVVAEQYIPPTWFTQNVAALQAAALAITTAPTDEQMALVVGQVDSQFRTAVEAIAVQANERSVDLAYSDGRLTTATEYEADGTTVFRTTTYGYTADQLTTVTEAGDGLTAVTTFTYDGAGLLTGHTRSVTP